MDWGAIYLSEDNLPVIIALRTMIPHPPTSIKNFVHQGGVESDKPFPISDGMLMDPVLCQ